MLSGIFFLLTIVLVIVGCLLSIALNKWKLLCIQVVFTINIIAAGLGLISAFMILFGQPETIGFFPLISEPSDLLWIN